MTYRERLWPGPWVWLLALSLVLMLGIAYGVALGPVAGFGIAAIGLAVGAIVITQMAARVVVGPDGLRAGPALLPWEFVGRSVVLDAEQAREARGPQGDRTAFLLLRPGVGPGAVVVEVTDPEDPHRTWLLASRDPEALARAIREARGKVAS